jgi:1,4-alpha-glucan branching enzyme
LLNFSNRGYAGYQLGCPRGGMWRVRFNSDASVYDAFFGNWSSYDTLAENSSMDGMLFRASIGVGPYSAVILSQD